MRIFPLKSYKKVVMVAYKILRATYIVTSWDEKKYNPIFMDF